MAFEPEVVCAPVCGNDKAGFKTHVHRLEDNVLYFGDAGTGDCRFDKPAGAVAYADVVDLFSGFKFDVCNLHNCTDNGGLYSTVQEADRTVWAGYGRELGGGTVLPITGYFEGLLFRWRQHGVFPAEIQAFEREIGEIAGSLGGCKG